LALFATVSADVADAGKVQELLTDSADSLLVQTQIETPTPQT